MHESGIAVEDRDAARVYSVLPSPVGSKSCDDRSPYLILVYRSLRIADARGGENAD